MRVSMGQVFAAATILCSAITVVWGWLFIAHFERATLAQSEQSRHTVSEGIEAHVATVMNGARDALLDIDHALGSGAIAPADARALEALLYTELLGSRHLAEATFTGIGVATDSVSQPRNTEADDPAGHFQLSVQVSPAGELISQRTQFDAGEFVTLVWRREPHQTSFEHREPAARMASANPTLHPTFVASASPEQEGEPVWSDLHYAETDLQQINKRIVITVQKAVRNATGQLLGVARVGLLTSELDAITMPKPSDCSSDDPHVIALLSVSARPEAPARLVSRVGPEDKILPIDEELRVQAVSPPPAVAALLSSPLLQGLDAQNPSREGALAVQGESWLATLSPLSIAGGGTAGWFVAVLVPETFYTHDLWQLARGLGVVFTVCLVLVLAIGGGALTVARRGVQSALRRTARMREFDFEPNAQSSRLSDVDALLLGIERAKTAARAMCKYIPVPLVRGLFERNHEPELGGEAREVSLLFSDLQGFTALSERLAPDQLATLLGHYFEVVTDALEQSGATIDKYIGDAVMAFWNAPADVADHSAAACRGVLACQAALRELYASDKWQALPPLVTRFGLHRATVLVGHFGSPTRLAYTAIGDGVNLASRLEGACKQYDVTVLASADFVAASEKHFEYRRLDSLTVRGKTRAIDVYELLGPRS